MKMVKIYTGSDQKTYFEEMDSGPATQQKLGLCSSVYPTTGVIFRDFVKGECSGWHNPTEPRYIVYLEGSMEVEASSGEKRIFAAGDILYAVDHTGDGHNIRSLSDGRSLIIIT
jgi:hypothetical protein